MTEPAHAASARPHRTSAGQPHTAKYRHVELQLYHSSAQTELNDYDQTQACGISTTKERTPPSQSHLTILRGGVQDTVKVFFYLTKSIHGIEVTGTSRSNSQRANEGKLGKFLCPDHRLWLTLAVQILLNWADLCPTQRLVSTLTLTTSNL